MKSSTSAGLSVRSSRVELDEQLAADKEAQKALVANQGQVLWKPLEKVFTFGGRQVSRIIVKTLFGGRYQKQKGRRKWQF